MGWTRLPLASGDDRGAAYGISDDGHVVLGYTGTADMRRACFWTDGTGPTIIGGTEFTEAYCATPDGSLVIGNSATGLSPFRWTVSGGVVHFGTTNDTALAVNVDGSRMVGSRFGTREQACFWNASGTVTLLGFLPGHDTSRALDVSDDGSVIVGQSYSHVDSSLERAFRWTAAGGMVDLGVTSGESGSRAFGVSADGTIVVGGLYSGKGFRWTSAGGMVAISYPNFIIATGISGDGSTIIGSAFNTTDPAEFDDSYLGYITMAGGIVVPTPINFDPSDPTFIPGTYPDGVSSNGKAMVGYSYGTPTFPWLYTVAPPMECFDARGSSSLIRCQNEAPVSPPTAHQYSFVGDLIISEQGAFQFVANAGTLRSLDFNVGWIAGGGWSGSGPGYGVFFHSDSNTGGSNFMEGVFGPLVTPPGTQFHIEIDVDTQAGTCVAYENGTAITRRNFFPGSPHFTPITMTDMQLGYAGDETDPDAFGCAANVGIYAGTTTPTGSPYVYLTIASGGTAASFFTNTGGTAGAFAPVGWTPHLCSDCQSPPPPEGGSPKLWLLRQPELHFIGTKT